MGPWLLNINAWPLLSCVMAALYKCIRMKMLPLFMRQYYTHSGKRKPSPEFYLQAIDHLNVDPASCIFIDDRLVYADVLLVTISSEVDSLTCLCVYYRRMVNIEAALSVGMVGLQFKNAEAMRKDLCALGVELPPLVCEGDAQVQ